MTLTSTFWSFYTEYFKSGFTIEEVWEEMNALLLPHADQLFKLKNPAMHLYEIMSFRVQADRTVGDVEFKVGNIVLIHKVKFEFMLVNKTCVTGRWDASEFAKIPFVEDGRVLLLPIYHIKDTEKVCKMGEISQSGLMEWESARTLWTRM